MPSGSATFLYLGALRSRPSGLGKVPYVSVGVVFVLLLASVAMFISLIQRISLLQVNRMLIFTGEQGRKVITTFVLPPSNCDGLGTFVFTSYADARVSRKT